MFNSHFFFWGGGHTWNYQMLSIRNFEIENVFHFLVNVKDFSENTKVSILNLISALNTARQIKKKAACHVTTIVCTPISNLFIKKTGSISIPKRFNSQAYRLYFYIQKCIGKCSWKFYVVEQGISENFIKNFNSKRIRIDIFKCFFWLKVGNTFCRLCSNVSPLLPQ